MRWGSGGETARRAGVSVWLPGRCSRVGRCWRHGGVLAAWSWVAATCCVMLRCIGPPPAPRHGSCCTQLCYQARRHTFANTACCCHASAKYCRDLFRYYHERLPGNFPFPAQPAWKAGDSPDHGEEPEDDGADEHSEHMEHDDVIGEPVRQPCPPARLPAHPPAWPACPALPACPPARSFACPAFLPECPPACLPACQPPPLCCTSAGTGDGACATHVVAAQQSCTPLPNPTALHFPSSRFPHSLWAPPAHLPCRRCRCLRRTFCGTA